MTGVHEIIEYPVILLELENLKIVSKLHLLTLYCYKLKSWKLPIFNAYLTIVIMMEFVRSLVGQFGS